MIRKMTHRAMQEISTHKEAFLILLILFLFKFILIISFNNTDWEPDSYMHFLELQTIYKSFPDNLGIGLGVWSKPLYAYVLGILAFLFNVKTFLFIQTINLLIFTLISYIVYKIVLRLTNNKSLGIFAIFLSSLSLTLFKSSTSALTEPIFTLTLILGFWFIIKNRYYLATFLISLSVLGRIEGLFFIGIYFLWLIIKLKNYKVIFHLILLAVPGLIWNVLGYIKTGYPLYIFDNGYPSIPGVYGYGQLYSFLWQFLTREPLVTFLYALGIYFIIRNIKNLEKRLEISLLLAWSFLFFLAQSFLWWKGLFGSAGLMRYFVSTIPFMIIIGCIGFHFFKDKILLRRIVLFISLQLILLLIFICGIIPSKKEYPIREDDLIKAGNWIKENTSTENFLGSDRPEVIYFAHRDLTNSTIFYKQDLQTNRPGYYIWTKSWGEKVSHVTVEDLLRVGEQVHSINNEIFIFRIK